MENEATVPKAFSIAETTHLLGLSRATICRHIAAGRIRAIKIGGRVLVPESALRAILEPDPKEDDRHGA